MGSGTKVGDCVIFHYQIHLMGSLVIFYVVIGEFKSAMAMPLFGRALAVNRLVGNEVVQSRNVKTKMNFFFAEQGVFEKHSRGYGVLNFRNFSYYN